MSTAGNKNSGFRLAALHRAAAVKLLQLDRYNCDMRSQTYNYEGHTCDADASCCHCPSLLLKTTDEASSRCRRSRAARQGFASCSRPASQGCMSRCSSAESLNSLTQLMTHFPAADCCSRNTWHAECAHDLPVCIPETRHVTGKVRCGMHCSTRQSLGCVFLCACCDNTCEHTAGIPQCSQSSEVVLQIDVVW